MNRIKILIWDFDGTLYKLTPAITADLRRAQYQVIAGHIGWTPDFAEKKFNELYRVRYDSSAQTVAVLSHLPVEQVGLEIETLHNRLDFIKRDERLVRMFGELKGYVHFLFTNGSRTKVLPALEKLGLSEQMFAGMVCVDTVGTVKPDPAGFNWIMAKTGLPAPEHCMIGDREEVDIIPAKKLGMKTIRVWSVSSPNADGSAETVYEVPDMLDRIARSVKLT